MIREIVRRILSKPELPGMVTCSAPTRTKHIYRFHPVTGIDANDPEHFRVSEEHRIEIAEMIRSGAVFYWEWADYLDEHAIEGYRRIEWQNFSFVAFATGILVERHETHVQKGS